MSAWVQVPESSYIMAHSQISDPEQFLPPRDPDGVATFCRPATRATQRPCQPWAPRSRPAQAGRADHPLAGRRRHARTQRTARPGRAGARAAAHARGQAAEKARTRAGTRVVQIANRANREAPKSGDSGRIARRSIKSRIARIVNSHPSSALGTCYAKYCWNLL